jgi:branched-chain amino acid transport system permease protein
MEAASISAGPPASQRIRALIGTYGLLVLLLALPVVYGIIDLRDDGNLVRLGENVTAGISNGAIWALVAIGYTLVYGIVELINFAHGEVFMIGSFISASFFMSIGLTKGANAAVLFFGLLLTLFVAMIGAGTLNAMIERVAYRPLRSPPSASRSSCRTSGFCGRTARRSAFPI